MPKVTVITLCYNHARFLRARIESILNQTFQDFEWIIIDDASQDGSQAILQDLRGHPKVKALILHSQNVGCYPSYNEALALAEGEYIYRAEGDDVCKPELLAAEVAVLDKHPNVGLVHTSCKVITGEGRVLRFLGESLKMNWHQEQIPVQIQLGLEVWQREIVDNFIAGPSVMFRKRCYETLSGFLPYLTRAADWEFWLRIALSYDLAYIPVTLASWRYHGDNLSGAASYRQTPQFLAEYYYVKQEAFGRVPPHLAHLRRLRPAAIRHSTWWISKQCKAALSEGNRSLVLKTLPLMLKHDPGAILDGNVARLVVDLMPGGKSWGPHLWQVIRWVRRRQPLAP